jgi:hypothetical protein
LGWCVKDVAEAPALACAACLACAASAIIASFIVLVFPGSHFVLERHERANKR